ncbi:CD3324 family protein [Gorillibacterium timonense]|uniref:CD3324 family protein n=1 Tax=Gorillibacterium timonense TaxID=1689269 RepID=UPI00071D4333|nr:CD3324 family protein [Gorillibacterium timonense]
MESNRIKDVLPAHLLQEVQRYIQGELMYIPTRSNNRKKWGESSGAASYYDVRNKRIRDSFHDGARIGQLAEQFGLSTDTIKKIVYTKR